MARPISDETAHKVTLHINNGYIDMLHYVHV